MTMEPVNLEPVVALLVRSEIWAPVMPAIVLVGIVGLAAARYSVRVSLQGPYRDPEIEARGSSTLLGMPIRLFFAWMMSPVWRAFLWSGIPANAITTLSVLIATASGVAAASGSFALSGWLFLLAGSCDYLDGRLARALGTASPRGAALDSILDRYADAAILIGLAWYFRGSWVLLAVLVAIVGSIMVPYVRARGEGLGAKLSDVGVLQRPERVVLLGLAVALSPLAEALIDPSGSRSAQRLAAVGIVVVAAATQITTAQRFLRLLSALGSDLSGHLFESRPGKLLRIVTVATVATLADFAVMLLLVVFGGLLPPLATVFGCAVGAALGYAIHAVWIVQDDRDAVPIVGRFVFVAATGALLNAGALAVLLLLPELDYRIGWWAARAAVFLLWNLPLASSYIFADAAEPVGVRVRR